MTPPRNQKLSAMLCRSAGSARRGLWAWIKSASPSAASSRSGLRKTSANAGDGGRVSSGSLVVWFYAAWRAEQWGILALCMLYTYAWARGLWIHWAGQRRLGCVVKDLDGQPQNSVETIRYPAVKGPPKTATVLNNSILHIGLMRRSIELTGIHIQDSKHAAWESQQLLARLHRDGF